MQSLTDKALRMLGRASLALLLGCSGAVVYPAAPPRQPTRVGGPSVEIPECRDSVLLDVWGTTCAPRCLPPTQVGILCTEMLGIVGWSTAPLGVNYAAAHDRANAGCPVPHWRVWRIDKLTEAEFSGTDFGAGARTIEGSDCTPTRLQEMPSRSFYTDHPGLSYYWLAEIFPTE